MSDDLAKSLDDCLDRIAIGRSVEQCLARYPRQRAELEPLLRAALLVRENAVKAPDATRVVVRARLLNRIGTRRSPSRSSRRPWFALPRAIAAAAAVAAVSGGAAVASASALPDEPLYPVKRAIENVQVALTTGQVERANLYLQMAERRLSEEASLAQRGRAAAADAAAKAYDEQIDRALKSIEQQQADGKDRDKAVDRLAEQLDRHQANMEDVLQRVPAEARPAIERAIETSQQGLRRARDLKEQGDDSRSVPGKATPVGKPQPSPTSASSSSPPRSSSAGATVTPGRPSDAREPGNETRGRSATPPAGTGEGDGERNNQGQGQPATRGR